MFNAKCNGLIRTTAQSAGAIEYTDWISADGFEHPSQLCPGYDIKQSGG